MGHQYQRKTDAASQKRRPKIAPGDEWQNTGSHVHAGQSSSSAILHLQRTIGNQAVQRLIQRDTAVPVDSRNDKANTNELPPFVARIIGERSKFESKSTIPGHEGKIGILSLSIQQNDHKVIVSFTKEVDELSPIFLAAATKGERLKEAEFMMIRRNDSDEIETVQTFEFKDGYVSSMSMSSGSSGGKASEFITLEFPVKPKKEK